MKYIFEPYDVLQISRNSGVSWVDFATLKDYCDAADAVKIVDTNGKCSGFAGQFRITNDSKSTIKYERSK